MNRLAGWAVLLLVLVFGGCAERKSQGTASQAAPPAQEQPAPSEPAPQVVPPVEPGPEPSPALAEPAPRPKAEPTPPPEAKPIAEAVPTPTATATAEPAQAMVAAPQEPAPAAPPKPAPKDVIALTGSPLGGVRFEHKLHVARAGNNCATCHHPSRPEKPANAPQQACSGCHTKVATPPMKTKLQGAFHDPTAQSGSCIDCHKAESAKGKKTPLVCMECHKPENK